MFGQFFANPAMLLGGLAIAAPVALFLLNRFRFRTVDWAALVFLERAFKRQKRRLQFENLILLLIRCLILILLAVAMARPTLRGDVVVDEEETSRNVVLLFDRSYSTGYQVGTTEDETVHARMRRAAKDLVASLEDGDRINVIAFDERARKLYREPVQINARTKKSVLADLDEEPELQLSERTTDLGEALHLLPRVLDQFDMGPNGKAPGPDEPPLKKTIFLLGDAQRLGVMDEKNQLIDKTLSGVAAEIKQKGGTIQLVDCGEEEPRNAVVARLATREAVVGRELPCHVEATLRNDSALDLKDLTVEYYVDGADTPQKTVSIDLGPESEATPDPLRRVFRTAGLHRVEVRIKSDPLQIDNRRHLVIDVREEVRTLLVDGERNAERWLSETDFLSAALAIVDHPGEGNRGLIRPEVVDESALATRPLEPYDLVVVANVVELADDVVTKLERYASEGGTVLFSLGGLVNADAYNRSLWREGRGLMPVKLLERRGGTQADAATNETAPEWVIALGNSKGHAVDLFREKELADWMRAASVFGYYGVELEPETKPEDWVAPWVPLNLVSRDGAPGEVADPQPLLVEKPYGRGRVVTWLTTIDDNWNNAVVYDVFYVLFWRELALDLSQRGRPRTNLEIGERYERILTAEQYAATVQVTTPSENEEGVPLEKLEGQDLYRLQYPDRDRSLQESGLYTLVRKGVAGGSDPAPDYFAVRIDPIESNLAKFNAEDLSQALGLEITPTKPEAVRERLLGDEASAGNREFWREAMVAVLLLLVLESVLAAYFGRRRN